MLEVNFNSQLIHFIIFTINAIRNASSLRHYVSLQYTMLMIVELHIALPIHTYSANSDEYI